MGHVLAMAVFQNTSGNPEDRFINTFHFNTGDNIPVVAADYTNIGNRLNTFYTAFQATGNAVMNHFSNVVAGAGAEVRMYDMADAKPRPVRAVRALSTINPGTGGIANESAVVLSFRAATPAGVLLRRRRGRIYIGPLTNQTTTVALSGGDLRPVAGFRTTLAQAAVQLRDAGAPAWAVFSRVDGVLANVISGFIDDALDTQRRRGRTSLGRTTW